MSSTREVSRRAMMRGAAALPVIAVLPAPTAAPVHAAPDPVVELAARTIAAWVELEAKCNAFTPYDEAMSEWRKKNPLPELRPYQVNQREAFHVASGKFFDIQGGLEEYVPARDMQAAAQEYKVANAKWKRRERAAKRRCGYSKADAERNACNDAVTEAIELLRDTQPRTIAGLVAKARAARAVDDEEELNRSLVWDIGEMFEQVA